MIKKIEKLIETDKPILIDGWAKTKEMFPNQKITNKVVIDNIFWTFSEKEKRSENIVDIEKFEKNCLDKFESKYKYYFINPLDTKYSIIKKIIGKINNIEGQYYYFDGRHYFILIDNLIIGIDTDFLKLTNIKKDKISDWLKSKKFVLFTDNDIFNIKSLNIKNYLLPAIKKEIEYEKEFIIGYIFK